MVIWSGKGVLSVVVLLVALLITTVALPDNFNIALGIACMIAAIFSWYFGRKWNSAEGKAVIDKETGEEILLKRKHSMFWISMEYWGVIFGILGVLVVVA